MTNLLRAPYVVQISYSELIKRENRRGKRTLTFDTKGKGNISEKNKNFWKTKKSGKMKLPFTDSYMNPENGKDPTKTGYSCHTKKDQSHPHSLPTGSSGRERDRDERCWENG